jgi:hypothetical protein
MASIVSLSGDRSSLQKPTGFIWISERNILTKTPPHELGQGATKTVYSSEYSSGFGFAIDKIEDEGSEFNANKYAIAEIRPKNTPSFTDVEMDDIHDELELQMDFAEDGKATKVLGLLLGFTDDTSVVAYTEADILHQLTLTPNPVVCYILMERCAFVTSHSRRSYGQTMSIWSINRGNPGVVVQQVIDCINHIVVTKHMIFYDFKEGNVCLSPDNHAPDNQVIPIDFDRHFCKYLDEVDWGYYDIRPATQEEVAMGYMFLLFSGEYYKNTRNPDPEVVAALYEGIQQLKIDQYLQQICRFSEMGRKNLIHYLIYHDDKDKQFSLVEYIEVNYLEQMKPQPQQMLMPPTKRRKGGKGTKRRMIRTKRRMNGRKNKKTKKRY